MAESVPEIVVDTGVVAKFFFTEDDSDKAIAIADAFASGRLRLIAPDFLFIEFANLAWMKTRRGACTQEDAADSIEALVRLSAGMEVIASRTILAEAFQISCDHNHAAYDTAFVALSRLRSAPFVTADTRLYYKIQSACPSAILLRNWRRA